MDLLLRYHQLPPKSLIIYLPLHNFLHEVDRRKGLPFLVTIICSINDQCSVYNVSNEKQHKGGNLVIGQMKDL